MKHIAFLATILPFCFFLVGYFVMQSCIPSGKTVPALVGLSLEHALPLLAQQSLNARIVQEKTDSSVLPGIILQQIPSAGQKARSHQTVLITVNKQPSVVTTPSFLHQPLEYIQQEAKKLELTLKIYWLEVSAPYQQCVAQVPPSRVRRTSTEEIIIYCAQKKQDWVLMPSLLNYSLQEVFSFLNTYGITPQLIEKKAGFYNQSKKIVQQRPLAGTLIDLAKPMSVQLLIE